MPPSHLILQESTKSGDFEENLHKIMGEFVGTYAQIKLKMTSELGELINSYPKQEDALTSLFFGNGNDIDRREPVISEIFREAAAEDFGNSEKLISSKIVRIEIAFSELDKQLLTIKAKSLKKFLSSTYLESEKRKLSPLLILALEKEVFLDAFVKQVESYKTFIDLVEKACAEEEVEMKEKIELYLLGLDPSSPTPAPILAFMEKYRNREKLWSRIMKREVGKAKKALS